MLFFFGKQFSINNYVAFTAGAETQREAGGEGREGSRGSVALTIYWLFFGLILTSGKLNCNCFRQSMGPPVYLTGNCRTIYPGLPPTSPASLSTPSPLPRRVNDAATNCRLHMLPLPGAPWRIAVWQSGSREHFKALFESKTYSQLHRRSGQDLHMFSQWLPTLRRVASLVPKCPRGNRMWIVQFECKFTGCEWGWGTHTLARALPSNFLIC